MKWLKRILLGLVILLLLIVLGAPLLLKAFFPEPRLREMILPRASEALGRPVDCGRIHLRLGWHGLGLRLDDLSLGADESGYGLKSVTLPRLEADLAWRQLLHKELAVRTLRFQQPRIELLLPPPGYQTPSADSGADTTVPAAAPAMLAVAAPDVRLESGVLLMSQKEGPLLQLEIPEAQFATLVDESGNMSLSARLELESIHLQQADLLQVKCSARVEIEAALEGERLEIQRCLLGLREIEVMASPPEAERPTELSGSGLDLELTGAAFLPALSGAEPDLSALELKMKLELRDLSLAPDPSGFGLREFVLPRVRMELSWPSSEPGELALGRMLIEEPRLELLLPRVESAQKPSVKPRAGKPRGQDAAKGRGSHGLKAGAVGGGSIASSAPPTAGAALAAIAVVAPDIVLKDGSIRVRQEDGPEISLSLPTGKLAGAFDEQEGLSLTADMNLDPIRLQQAERLDGKTSAELSFELCLVDEHVEIRNGSLRLAALNLSVWPPPPGEKLDLRGGGMDLKLSGDAPLAALMAKPPDLDALVLGIDLDLRPLTLESPSLAKPVQLMEARLRGDSRRFSLQSLRLRSGSSQLQLVGEITLLPEPRMRLDLESPGLDMADFTVAPAKGAGDEATEAGQAKESALWPPLLLPGSLDFRLDRLRSEQAIFENLSGRLLVETDSIRIEDLRGGLLDGDVSGRLLLRPDENNRVHCEGNFQVQKVQAPAFLAAFTPVKRGVAGSLSSQFEFKTKLVPGQRPEGLDLDAKLDLRDGVLDNPPVLQTIFQTVGLQSRERYELGRFRQLLQLRQDRVITERLKLPLDDGELRASGSVGLDGSLDYRGTWVLGPATVARLGKSSPLRVLVDERGHISIDFILRGDLKHPRVTLDQRAIEERLRKKAEEELKEEGDKLKEEGEKLIKKGLDDLKKWLK